MTQGMEDFSFCQVSNLCFAFWWAAFAGRLHFVGLCDAESGVLRGLRGTPPVAAGPEDGSLFFGFGLAVFLLRVLILLGLPRLLRRLDIPAQLAHAGFELVDEAQVLVI